jgi:polysaccharide export outer membrane protein
VTQREKDHNMYGRTVYAAAILIALLLFAPLAAQQRDEDVAREAGSKTTGVAPGPAVTVPPGYVIGTEDVLSIVFWRDKDMSADVVVRPDGKISLPLINDIHAADLTPDQLREEIVKRASKFIEEPTASVVVKEIHSRNVFITGLVNKGGTFPIIGSMNVMQLIALAGGVQEYADSGRILITRATASGTQQLKFNYKEFIKGKNVQQNIVLEPGDTVVVP